MNIVKNIAIIIIAIFAIGAMYIGINHYNSINNVVVQRCAGLGSICKHNNHCCSKKCILGTCRREHCKYGESTPGVCNISPENTLLAVELSKAALEVAAASQGSGATA